MKQFYVFNKMIHILFGLSILLCLSTFKS